MYGVWSENPMTIFLLSPDFSNFKNCFEIYINSTLQMTVEIPGFSLVVNNEETFLL